MTPFDAVAELLREQPDPAALAVLRRGASAWLRARGTVPFDRCLKLPSARQIRRQTRDFAIAEALRLVPGATGHARALLVHRLLTDNASRGTWHRWHSMAGPPADCGALQHRAYEVLSNGGNPAAPTVPSLTLLRQHAAEIWP